MRLSHLMIVAVAAALLACGGDDGTGAQTCTGSMNSVQVNNNVFNPACTRVTAGATVTWTWASAPNPHNVTWRTGPGTLPMSSSTSSAPGFQYSAMLNTAGTYTYVCTIHEGVGMTGSVEVQ